MGKTGDGPGGSRPMAFSYDYISGCVHVGRTCTMGMPGTTVLLIVH